MRFRTMLVAFAAISAFSLFLYFSVASGVWFVDGQATGWTLMSVATFFALSAFAVAFGYLRFLKTAAFHRTA